MKTLIEITQESWGASVLVLLGLMYLVALSAMFVMDWRWRKRHDRMRKRRNEKIYRRAEKHGVA